MRSAGSRLLGRFLLDSHTSQSSHTRQLLCSWGYDTQLYLGGHHSTIDARFGPILVHQSVGSMQAMRYKAGLWFVVTSFRVLVLLLYSLFLLFVNRMQVLITRSILYIYAERVHIHILYKITRSWPTS